MTRIWRHWNPHALLAGVKDGVAILENDVAGPQVAKHGLIIWPSNSTPSYIPMKYENIHILCMNIHISIIQNSTQMEKNKQMLINCWMDFKNVLYLENGKLFILKKEWNSCTCYNMVLLWKPYAEWKKASHKRLHKAQFVKSIKAGSMWLGSQGLEREFFWGEGGNREWILIRIGFLGYDVNVQNLIVGMVEQVHEYIKIIESYILNEPIISCVNQ